MEDKHYYVFRFITQERATNYLNKVVKQFDEYVVKNYVNYLIICIF